MVRIGGENVETVNGEMSPHHIAKDILQANHLSQHSLVLVQSRKTRPCLTERLLMGLKESNQTKKAYKTMFFNYCLI